MTRCSWKGGGGVSAVRDSKMLSAMEGQEGGGGGGFMTTNHLGPKKGIVSEIVTSSKWSAINFKFQGIDS